MTTLTKPTPGLLRCPPRFGTPRNFDRPTLGGEVADIQARLRRPPMPHQAHIADVALELDDDGSLYYSEIVVVLGRQEGKTEEKIAVNVHRMTRMVQALGPQVATFTMQTRAKARKKLERDYCARLRGSSSFREITNFKARPQRATEWLVRLNNGAEEIQFGPESFLQIDAPSRTGGHGDTLDLGSIDEAFAHIDDTVEQSMTPAMITRPSSQLWVWSAAGDGKSKYLWRKILAGRAACESGNHGRTAYFEWSAPDDLDPSDPATWALACPALGDPAEGFTITEAKLQAEWEKAVRGGQAGIDMFRRAFLCQWPEVPVLDDGTSRWLVVPEAVWASRGGATHNPTHARYALEVDTNARGETWASLARSDGSLVQMVTPIDAPEGTGWVVPACAKRKTEIGELLIAQDGQAAALINDLEAEGVKVRRVKPSEFVAASMQFLDACVEGTLRHADQTVLDRAVASVVKRDVGDGQWRFSRKLSSADVGPVCAAAIAKWGAGLNEDGPSVYEERGMASL